MITMFWFVTLEKIIFFILITEIDIRKLFLYEEMLKTLQPKL